MRALAGLFAFLAIVMIAVIMIIQEQIRLRKSKPKEPGKESL
jgi:hypothetical protein